MTIYQRTSLDIVIYINKSSKNKKIKMDKKNILEKRIDELLSLIKRYEEGKLTTKQVMDLYNNSKKNHEHRKRKN